MCKPFQRSLAIFSHGTRERAFTMATHRKGCPWKMGHPGITKSAWGTHGPSDVDRFDQLSADLYEELHQGVPLTQRMKLSSQSRPGNFQKPCYVPTPNKIVKQLDAFFLDEAQQYNQHHSRIHGKLFHSTRNFASIVLKTWRKSNKQFMDLKVQ